MHPPLQGKSLLGQAMHAFRLLRPVRAGQIGAILFGLIANVPVYAASQTTRISAFDYDAASGLLIKEVIEPSDSDKCVVTTYGLDDYGHRTTSTTRTCSQVAPKTPGGVTEAAAPTGLAWFPDRTTTETYNTDSAFAQQYAATTTNALNQTETKTYDPRFGAMSTLTGPNQLTTAWLYDAFGRKVAERRADGTGTRWEYKYCGAVSGGTEACPTIAGAVGIYTVTVTPLKAFADINAYATAAVNGPYVKVYHDALGREIRSETLGFDAKVSQMIYQDTEYDSLGRVKRKSRPYYSGTTNQVWTTYAYDTLGRVTSTNEPTSAGTATTTVAYNGLETTTIDPMQHRTIETRNVNGKVVSTLDNQGNALGRTYDAYDNLVQTIDAKGNVISLTYDTRGRKTDQYDPDMGVWHYKYNALGELVQQTNAKQQVSTSAYDLLGRMWQHTEPDLTSTWSYDKYLDNTPCTKGVGKLCEVKTDNGYSSRTNFDAVGRVLSTVTTIGSTYTSSVTYDPQTGKVVTQTYPSGLQIRNDYTPGLGFFLGVTDMRNQQPLWSAQSFDAEGHVLQYTHGNSLAGNNPVVTTNDYTVDGRLNTTRAGPSGAVQMLSHSYDLGGKLTSRSDLLTGVVANYVYDDLNRLTSETRSGGSVSPPQVIAWQYDSIGNMVGRTEGGATNTYNYPTSGLGSARPHAVANVSGSVNGYSVPVYSYDANSNLVSGAGRNVSWTSFDKVQSISKGGARLDYVYDASHERAQELYSNGALQRRTVYLNPGAGAGLYYEEETGAAGTKLKNYVSAGGMTVAMITCSSSPCTAANSTTQYWHLDHLASVSVVTNDSGVPVERMAYEPFGKRRNANGVTDTYGALTPSSTDRGYTGHEHLDEVGLINMNGRVFDPGLGRFMSADPFIQNPGSLQSYNRYSYGWNSPLNGADPSGYSWASDTWHKTWHNEIFQAAVTIAIANDCGSCAVAYAFARTYYDTRSPGQGLKAAALTWISQTGDGLIGDATQYFDLGSVFNTAAHTAWGCVTSHAEGGSCRSGAWSGGAGAALSNYGVDLMQGWGRPTKVTVHALLGGTASVLGRGKFANGAITAAFGYIFNAGGEHEDSRSAAFRSARQDAGIPNSAIPTMEDQELYDGNKAYPRPIVDKDGNPVKARVYKYEINGKIVEIQEHAAGHMQKLEDGRWVMQEEGHFNVRDANGKILKGTRDHYNFRWRGDPLKYFWRRGGKMAPRGSE